MGFVLLGAGIPWGSSGLSGEESIVTCVKDDHMARAIRVHRLEVRVGKKNEEFLFVNRVTCHTCSPGGSCVCPTIGGYSLLFCPF